MPYFKKSVIIKSSYSTTVKPLGIATVSAEGEDCFVDISFTVRLGGDGDYYAFLFDGKNSPQKIEILKTHAQSQFSITKGFDGVDILVVKVKDGATEIFAFGDCLKKNTASGLFKIIKDDFVPYDDFAIAEDNYYQMESVEYGKDFCYQNVDAKSQGEKEPKKTPCVFTADKDVYDCDKRQSSDYYIKVKKQVDGAFSQYRSTLKTTIIPNNGRVLEVSSGGKDFIFGLTGDNLNPDYLCYGVVGERANPPKKLRGKACYIPNNPFDLEDGFWLVFQSAVTGEVISE